MDIKGDNTVIKEIIEPKELELSMCSIVGLMSWETIKLWGTIGKKSTMILIDCRASHNFISAMFVRQGLIELRDRRKLAYDGGMPLVVVGYTRSKNSTRLSHL